MVRRKQVRTDHICNHGSASAYSRVYLLMHIGPASVFETIANGTCQSATDIGAW
jgi:hypothetical protein